MRIISAYVGDRLPQRQANAYVTDRCAAAGVAGFVCISCFTYAANAYNLVEHLGLLLDQTHMVAEHCSSCHGYHPLTALALESVRSQAQLWPLPPDNASAGAIEPDPLTIRDSSG